MELDSIFVQICKKWNRTPFLYKYVKNGMDDFNLKIKVCLQNENNQLNKRKGNNLQAFGNYVYLIN